MSKAFLKYFAAYLDDLRAFMAQPDHTPEEMLSLALDTVMVYSTPYYVIHAEQLKDVCEQAVRGYLDLAAVQEVVRRIDSEVGTG